MNETWSDAASNHSEQEFDPTAATRNVLGWAADMGAMTLGEAYEMLERFAMSNDVAEVLGHDDSIDDVREDMEYGLEISGPETSLTMLL